MKPVRLPERAIVAVRWNDAHASAGDLIDAETIAAAHRPSVVTTIGWLMRDDDAGVSLCVESTDFGFRGHTFIPRSCVLSTRMIRSAPKPRPVA